jgi:hypothetical protein
MVEIKEEKLSTTYGGGVTITGSLVESIVNVAKVIFGFGQDLGSSIRRLSEDSMCPLQ